MEDIKPSVILTKKQKEIVEKLYDGYHITASLFRGKYQLIKKGHQSYDVTGQTFHRLLFQRIIQKEPIPIGKKFSSYYEIAPESQWRAWV